MASKGLIAVYGASGYTGRLVAQELARRELECVLVGRNESRLREAMRGLGVKLPIRQAALDDPSTLRRALRDAAVVINCAGPFTKLGEPVIQAAIDSETNYLDTTGEQAFIQLVFERYASAAERAGIALVPAMGFDYVPGDLLCDLVAHDLEPLREIVIAYWLKGFGASRGTLHSALTVLKGGDLAYEDGDWQPAGFGPLRATFGFPSPIGRKPVGKFPSGEIISVPHHVQTRKVTSLVATEAFVPNRALARIVPFTMPGLSLTMRTPIHRVIEPLIERLPDGPDDRDRKAARFVIAVTAHGEDGGKRTGIVKGRDMYGLTAVTTVQGAEWMADRGFKRAGALAPAQAFNPTQFLDLLTAHGLSYKLGKVTKSRGAA